MRYRKKRVEVEAVEWNGDLKDIDAPWFNKALEDNISHLRDNELYIDTLEGEMHVSAGDFIIRGVKGEIYPCKPDIFWETYEAAGEPGLPDDYAIVTKTDFQTYLMNKMMEIAPNEIDQVGRMVGFIDDVFTLQNNVRQRVFIFGVEPDIIAENPDFPIQLSNLCRTLDIAGAIVPKGTCIEGQITAGSWTL